MPTPKQIKTMVEQKEQATSSLRKRWDADYGLWRGDPYMGMDPGFKNFTSTEPRVNAKKAIGMVSGALLTVEVPENNDNRSQRDQDNFKEQFIRGNLRANDERLIKIGLTGTLQQTMAWQIMVRGTTCGRALFRRKNGNGRAIADATPWDPRDTFWEFGPNGLAWICHRYSSLRAQTEKDWQITVPFEGQERPEQQVLTIYDFYDPEGNWVVTDNQETVLKAEAHGVFDGDGDPIVPAWVNANTLQPQITPPRLANNQGMTESQLADALTDYGESIFADMRHPLETYNRAASIRLNLVDRSLKPPFSIKSPSGIKRIEYDPYITGAEFPLGTDEEFIVHELMQSAPDTDALTGLAASELQKAGFPAISFGNLADPISGFAIQNLKGGVADKVIGGVQACNSAFMAIGNIWSDHFSSGAFGGMELSGRGRNRKWFAGFTTPDMIRDLPQAELELVPELPEDQAGVANLANMYRQPGTNGDPLLGDYSIRTDILHREDSGLDADDIRQQQASQNPLIRSARTTDAMANRGDGDAVWAHTEFIGHLAQLFAALASMGIDLNEVMANYNPQDSGSLKNPANFPSNVLPTPATGAPALTPGVDTPAQPGPVVPAGRPRPGAQV